MEQLQFNLPDFADGDVFPPDYTGRGKDISSEIVIGNLSAKAKTLAVTLEDVSHPIKNFTHWVIWNIPAASKIEKAIPKGKDVPGMGATQGVAYGIHRYAGPKPPRGRTHTYRMTVYALDCILALPARKRKKRNQSQNRQAQPNDVSASFPVRNSRFLCEKLQVFQ